MTRMANHGYMLPWLHVTMVTSYHGYMLPWLHVTVTNLVTGLVIAACALIGANTPVNCGVALNGTSSGIGSNWE